MYNRYGGFALHKRKKGEYMRFVIQVVKNSDVKIDGEVRGASG